MIGSIAEDKGQFIAVRACVKLHDGGKENFRLKIVDPGEGNYISKLRQYVKEHHASHYIEFCDGTDKLEKFYKLADVTLMCSTAEAFGRVTVEAMISGFLLVASDGTGSREIIEHRKTGLMFTCGGDADDLASKLSYAFSHVEEMREIAGKGGENMRWNASRQKEMLKKLITFIRRSCTEICYGIGLYIICGCHKAYLSACRPVCRRAS